MRIVWVALLLIAQSLVAAAQMPPPNGAPVHSIAVSGEYNQKLIPDEAYVNVTAYGKAAAQNEAKQKADNLLREVKRVAESLQIAQTQIKTQYVAINPVYEYHDNSQKLVGYEASYAMQITVKDLPTVGELMDRLVKAGIDRIGGVQYGVQNDEAARLIAMQKAYENAKIKAQTIAQSAGVVLGKPLYISENGGGVVASTPMIYAARADDMAMVKAESAVSPPSGEMNVNSNIYVIFAIE